MKLPFLIQKPLNFFRWFIPSQWEMVEIKMQFQMDEDMTMTERRKEFLAGTFRVRDKVLSMKAKGWKVASRAFEPNRVILLFKRLK